MALFSISAFCIKHYFSGCFHGGIVSLRHGQPSACYGGDPSMDKQWSGYAWLSIHNVLQEQAMEKAVFDSAVDGVR